MKLASGNRPGRGTRNEFPGPVAENGSKEGPGAISVLTDKTHLPAIWSTAVAFVGLADLVPFRPCDRIEE